MGGSYYILLINIALAAVLLFGFLAFYIYDRSRKSALFFFLGTLFFLTSGGLEIASAKVPDDFQSLFRFVLYSVNLSAAVLLTCGVVAHYRLKPHWGLVLVGFLAGLVLTYLVLDMPRQSVLRLSLNQIPIVTAIAVGAWRASTFSRKTTIDKLVIFAMSLFALNLAARPIILAIYGSMGESLADFHSTQYALVVQFSLVIVTMTTATILMLALVADIVGRLKRESRNDPLTQILNRRGFEEEANSVLQQSTLSSSPVALITADLDNFKNINDSFGHDAGDQVIVFFGELLGQLTRKSDFAARVGGEEFCLLVSQCTAAQASKIADSIRRNFNNSTVPGVPDGLHFTASFGVTEYIQGESLSTMIKRADVALYRAKKEGRNRVEVESPLTERNSKNSTGTKLSPVVVVQQPVNATLATRPRLQT